MAGTPTQAVFEVVFYNDVVLVRRPCALAVLQGVRYLLAHVAHIKGGLRRRVATVRDCNIHTLL